MNASTGRVSPDGLIRNPHLEGAAFLWEGGPTGVLLIHGYTATTAEVRLLAGHLSQRGYTVAGPLLPGHHVRPADANRYKWQDWVQAVSDACRDLAARCERVVVGGESTGALLALYLASEHPEVAAVLAYAPALQLRLSALEVLGLYVASPFIPWVRKADGDDGNPWQGYTVYPLRGARELLLLQREVRRRLPSIRQPLLVVQGRLDPTVDRVAAEEVYSRARSPLKELHWLERSAHCVLLDCEWETVAALSTRFLDLALQEPAATTGYVEAGIGDADQSSVIVMAPSGQADSHE